jgi:hypothetical protein
MDYMICNSCKWVLRARNSGAHLRSCTATGAPSARPIYLSAQQVATAVEKKECQISKGYLAALESHLYEQSKPVRRRDVKAEVKA